MTWVAWTTEASDQLRELVADGHTMQSAAKAMGPHVTRGMVAGRARRMGLKWATPPTIKMDKKPKKERKRVTVIKLPKPPPPPPWHGEALELVDLTPYSCRWPVGPGDRWTPQKFCGAPCGGVEYNHPYCAPHERKAGRYYRRDT
jgi:hypothetical protein